MESSSAGASVSATRGRLRSAIRVPNMNWIHHPEDADFALKILRLVSREDLLVILHETYRDLAMKSKHVSQQAHLSRVLFTPRTCLRENQQMEVGQQLDEARSEQSSEMLALFAMWGDLRQSRSVLSEHNVLLTQRVVQMEEEQKILSAALEQQRLAADAARDALAVVVQENEELARRAESARSPPPSTPQRCPPAASAPKAAACLERLEALAASIRCGGGDPEAGTPGSAQTVHVLLSPSAARPSATPSACSYCSASPPPPGEPCPVCVSPGRLPLLAGALAPAECAASPPAPAIDLFPESARTPAPSHVLRTLAGVQEAVRELAAACAELEGERDAARRESETLRARLAAAAAAASAAAASPPRAAKDSPAKLAEQFVQLQERLAASDRNIEALRAQLEHLDTSAAPPAPGHSACEVGTQAPTPGVSPAKEGSDACANSIRIAVDAMAEDCREMRRTLELAACDGASASAEVVVLRSRVAALESENESLLGRLDRMPLVELAENLLSSGSLSSRCTPQSSCPGSLPPSRASSPPPLPDPPAALPRPARAASAVRARVRQLEAGPPPPPVPESLTIPHREWPFSLHRTSSMEPVTVPGEGSENADKENAEAAGRPAREPQGKGRPAPAPQPLQLRRSYNI